MTLKKRLKMVLTTIVVLLVLAVIALRLSVPTLGKDSVASGVVTVNGQASLGDCPDTPNCQGSESTREEQRISRIAVDQPALHVMEILLDVIAQQPGATVVEQTEHYLHATFTTRLMGYIDDVEFLISDDEKSVQVRSASRIGVSDLGTNGKRIEQLRIAIESAMP